MSVIFIPSQDSLDPSETIEWDQDGQRRDGSVITDKNNLYTRANNFSLRIRHLKFLKKTTKNKIRRIDSGPGGWDLSSFSVESKLLFTGPLKEKDGPIVIEFEREHPVSAVGAHIQSRTLGEFTGVILAIDNEGLGYRFKRLGESKAENDTAIFLGVASPRSNIIRVEFSTINIVENGHTNFDSKGFAIDSLSIAD